MRGTRRWGNARLGAAFGLVVLAACCQGTTALAQTAEPASSAATAEPPSAPPTAQPAPPPAGSAAPQPPVGPLPQYAPYPYYPYPYRGFRLPGPMSAERPEEIPYEDSARVPQGYKVEQRVRLGLLITGASLFALSYSISLLVAFDEYNPDAEIYGGRPYGRLFIPFVGSLLFAPEARKSEAIFYALDGIVQLGGTAMAIAGIVSKYKVYVRKGPRDAYEPEILVGPGSIGFKMNF